MVRTQMTPKKNYQCTLRKESGNKKNMNKDKPSEESNESDSETSSRSNRGENAKGGNSGSAKGGQGGSNRGRGSHK